MTTWHYETLDMKELKKLIKVMMQAGKQKHQANQLSIDLDNMLLTIQDTGQVIELERTPCNYGNYRYWYRCPRCNRRCSKLFYLKGLSTPWHIMKHHDTLKGYQCNKCANYHKFTLNRTKTDSGYYWQLAIKEGRKIDPTYNPDNYINMQCPDKPKGMHWQTYNKHYQRFFRYNRLGAYYWYKGAMRTL